MRDINSFRDKDLLFKAKRFPMSQVNWTILACLLMLPVASVQAATSVDILVNQDAFLARQVTSIDPNDNSLSPNVNGPAYAEFIYRAKVKVNGVGSVENVKLTQQLPVGAEVLSVINADATCSTNGGNLYECNVHGTVDGSAFKVVDFKVRLPAVATNWLAVASASAPDNTDPEVGNNSAIERNITTYAAPDLGVRITAPVDDSEVIKGIPYQYSIEVTNHPVAAGSDAFPLKKDETAVIRFPVPVGTTVSSAPSGNGWSCSIESGDWVCLYKATADIPVDEKLPPLIVEATSNVDGGGGATGASIGASVAVSSRGTNGVTRLDANDANDIASVTVRSIADNIVDLTLQKSVSPALVDVKKREVVYTLTPTRARGETVPANVTITDTLPVGVTFLSDESGSNGWACTVNAGIVTCTFTGTHPDIGKAYPAAKFKAQTPAAITTDAIENTATVHADNEHESARNNNSDSASFKISNEINLDLAKSESASPVAANEAFFYTIAVTNKGPLALQPGDKFTVVDDLDDKLFYQGWDSTQSGWSCNPGAASTTAGQSVSCTYEHPAGAAPIAKDAKISDLKLNVKVVDQAALGGTHATIENKAKTDGVDGRDKTGGIVISNDAVVQASQKAADLKVTKSADKTSGLKTGDEVVYTLIVSNEQPAGNDANGQPWEWQAATKVELEDTIPNLIPTTDGRYAQAPFNFAPYSNGQYYEFVSITPSADVDSADVTCTQVTSNSGKVTCEVAILPQNASVEVKVRAKHFFEPSAADATQGSFKNTATVESKTTRDSDPGNNNDDVDVSGETLVDMTLGKSVSPATDAKAGAPLTYILSASNLGPSKAAKVTVVDELPLQTFWIGGQPKFGSNNGAASCKLGNGAEPADGVEITDQNRTLTCVWSSEQGKDGNYTAEYQLRSAAQTLQNQLNYPSELKNTAVVSTDTFEANKANNEDEAVVTLVQPEVDVMIDMRHTKDGIPLEATTEYIISVTNNQGSSSYATNVVMVNDIGGILDGTAIPSSAIFDNLTIDRVQMVDSEGNPKQQQRFDLSDCSFANNQLTCEFDWLAPGEQVDVHFTMKAASITAGRAVGSVFHSASVKADVENLQGVDVAANNRTADRTSTYDPAAFSGGNPPSPADLVDLSLQKQVATPYPTVVPGETVTYTLTVKNEDRQTASNSAELIDDFPEHLEFINATPAAACQPLNQNREIVCAVPALNPQETAEFVITARVPNPYAGDLTQNAVNTARVVYANDPVPENNDDEARFPFEPNGGLALRKATVSAPAVLYPGETLTYQLTVANRSTDNRWVSQGATIRDELPTGLQFVSADSRCVNNANVVTCDVGDLNAGDETSFDIVTTVAKPYTGSTSLINRAVLTDPTDPNNPKDDTTTVTVDPYPDASLAIEKLLVSTSTGNQQNPVLPVGPGNEVTFNFKVSNTSTDQRLISYDAKVVDALPKGLEFVSADAACTYADGSVSCDVGELAAGADITFALTAKISMPYTGVRPLKNIAQLFGPEDPTTPVDEDDVTVPLIPDMTAVPTLSQYGLMLLSAMLAMFALYSSRKRKLGF